MSRSVRHSPVSGGRHASERWDKQHYNRRCRVIARNHIAHERYDFLLKDPYADKYNWAKDDRLEWWVIPPVYQYHRSWFIAHPDRQNWYIKGMRK